VADGGRQQRKPDLRTAVEDLKALATVLAMEAESILGRRTARFLGVLVLFAIVVGVLLAFLNWYIAPSGAAQKQEVVATSAQILGGTALLLGLYLTWRTLQVNRQGQITERFTRAIDQLGATDNEANKLFEIRLGGIYALERIAKESEEDYWPIMEVLTAYVRQNASLKSEKESLEEIEGGSVEDVRDPAPDIQAIMTVIRRRPRSRGHGEPEGLDLREANLSGANLWKALLSRAVLFDVDLSRVNLFRVDLTQALLVEANLWKALLSEADLSGANLTRADLSGADLSGAVGSDKVRRPEHATPFQPQASRPLGRGD
jgi:hypothetical protein